jgi:hypothetical protein
MLPSTPRRPASAGPSGRDVTTPKSALNRELPQLPQLPPLGIPIDLSPSTNSKNSTIGGGTTEGALLWDVIIERDVDGNVSDGQS